MAGRPKKRAERGPPWTMEGDWKRNDHPLAYPNSVDALFYPDSSIPLLPSHALLTLIPQDGGHLARFQRYEDEPEGVLSMGGALSPLLPQTPPFVMLKLTRRSGLGRFPLLAPD